MRRPNELVLCLRCVFRCKRTSLGSKLTSEASGELDRAHHLGQQSIVVNKIAKIIGKSESALSYKRALMSDVGGAVLQAIYSGRAGI